MATTIERIDAHTAHLLATAGHLDDLGMPSLCDDWNRAHILSHLARNGDGMANLVRAAVDGEPLTMYRSAQGRDLDIAAGAERAPHEILADLERSAATALAALTRLGPEHAEIRVARTPDGPFFRAADLPAMRLRELVYHHVDLRAGFTFADVDPDLLHAFLERELELLRGRPDAPSMTIATDEGDRWTVGTGPAAEVTGPRHGVLLWLARRRPDGLHTPTPPTLPRGL